MTAVYKQLGKDRGSWGPDSPVKMDLGEGQWRRMWVIKSSGPTGPVRANNEREGGGRQRGGTPTEGRGGATVEKAREDPRR